MSERRLVIDHLKLTYEGLFNVNELYTTISSFFFDKNWDWLEIMNQEMITPDGKQVRIVLFPWKSSSDYYRLRMRVKIHCTDVKDVEVEHNGSIVRLGQGQVRITIDGYVVSDRFSYWEGKPWQWFISIILEKYLFKHHWDKLETWLTSDVEDLFGRIKQYLNMTKYTYRT